MGSLARKGMASFAPYRVLFGSWAEWVMGRLLKAADSSARQGRPPKGHLSPGVPASGVGGRPQEAPKGGERERAQAAVTSLERGGGSAREERK